MKSRGIDTFLVEKSFYLFGIYLPFKVQQTVKMLACRRFVFSPKGLDINLKQFGRFTTSSNYDFLYAARQLFRKIFLKYSLNIVESGQCLYSNPTALAGSDDVSQKEVRDQIAPTEVILDLRPNSLFDLVSDGPWLDLEGDFLSFHADANLIIIGTIIMSND